MGKTMQPTVEVRCGGHVTLLFAIDKSSRLPRNQGSRGAGFSVHHGVVMEATLHTDETLAPAPVMAGIEPDPQRTTTSPAVSDITIVDASGEPLEDTGLYLDFLQACRESTLLRDHERLEVRVSLECPTSQGFGMSAAGLMALGEAVHALTGRGRSAQYHKIAHRIEREHGAGLGDVLGLSVGGVELRLEPGAPGWPGQAVSFACTTPVLLVWDSTGERHTSLYIDDPVWQTSITEAGEKSLATLRRGDWNEERWPALLEEARAFAETSGMLSEDQRATVHQTVLNAIVEHGLQAVCAARLCMLGSSVVVLPRNLDRPPTNEELERLEHHVRQAGLSAMQTDIAPVRHPN